MLHEHARGVQCPARVVDVLRLDHKYTSTIYNWFCMGVLLVRDTCNSLHIYLKMLVCRHCMQVDDTTMNVSLHDDACRHSEMKHD